MFPLLETFYDSKHRTYVLVDRGEVRGQDVLFFSKALVVYNSCIIFTFLF
jgi:hypothetical protein